MKEKAEKTALHEVEESLKLLPSRDEVIEMRTNVRENIARFQKDNKEFKDQFDTHLSIIARYDEVIADKASKHGVYEQANKITNKFTPLVDKLFEESQRCFAELYEHKDRFTEFSELMQSEIYNAVKKTVTKQIKQYMTEKSQSAAKNFGM